MAVIKQSDSQIHPEIEIEDVKTLKHLEFIQVAAVNTIGCLLSVYDYAKKNSGPLKSGVENVEGTVKTVVKPVYDKFYDVPIEVLKFVDGKVGESIEKVNNVHSQVKQVSGQAVSAAQQAPTIARAMASDVHRAGVETASGVAKSLYVKYEPTAKELYSKYEPTAKELYSKYEPVAEKCAVSTWRKLNQLPLFPKVAQVVVPAAAYCTEKYNQTVESTAEKGYMVSSYLPVVPTEKIAKIFSNDRDLSEPLVSGNVNIEIRGQ